MSSKRKKGMVRSADVARHLEVSKPSVCHAVATLKKGGFLLMDGDHFLHLTDAVDSNKSIHPSYKIENCNPI